MFVDKRHAIQPAWDIFNNGGLVGAERAAMQAPSQLGRGLGMSPMSNFMIIKAYYLSRLKRYDDV